MFCHWSTYVFAFAAVPAEASQAAVDDLDAAEHQLQAPHGQQDGEQDHVPHHCVVGELADCPALLLYEVATVTPEKCMKRAQFGARKSVIA